MMIPCSKSYQVFHVPELQVPVEQTAHRLSDAPLTPDKVLYFLPQAQLFCVEEPIKKYCYVILNKTKFNIENIWNLT